VIPVSPHRSLLVHPTKNITIGDFSYGGPVIDCSLHPDGHWHRPHVPAFSNEVSDYPVFFPKLQVFHTNGNGFCAAKPATKKYGKDCTIAFPAHCVRARAP
jgi:hypothetical protein